MDERKLEELFRDSVGTAPPAAFDEQDVAQASRRITARRRIATVSGTAVAAAVLVGVGLGSGMFMSSTGNVAGPSIEPAQISPRLSEPGIMGDRSGQCGPDPQLAEAVTKQLPEAAESAPSPASRCPSGAKGASFVLHEGAAAGRVTAIVSPPGTMSSDQSTPGDVRRPDGSEQSVRKARSGKLVVVLSDPDVGSPAAPYGTRIATLAGVLADQY